MKRVNLGLLASTFMITACGGGDGGSFSGGEPVSDSFPITVANGEQAARLSYEATLGSGGFSDLDSLPIGAAPNDGFAIADIRPSPEDLVLDVISLAPYGPIVEECPGGGLITESGDRASELTLTPGDTITIEYESCNDGAGTVTDGVLDLTITDFSLDLATGGILLAVDAVVTGFTVMTGTDTATAEGDTSITVDTREMLFVTTTVSGTEMVQTTNSISQTLTGYGSTTTVDSNQQPEEFTIDSFGTLNHSDLEGPVFYSTTTGFRGFVPEYPREGVLLVQGDNSTARLIVLDENTVRIEIDENADGTPESSEDMSWDEFLGITP